MLTGRPRNRPRPKDQRQRSFSKLHVRLLLILFGFVLAGCQPKPGGDFAIYLLQGQLSGVDVLAQDPSVLPKQEQPILTTQDIVRYKLPQHEIELTENAYRRIWDLFKTPVKTDGMPFVVTVGEASIYAGAFWTPLSSLSYNGIVIMQPMEPGSSSIRIEQGYPGPDFFGGADPRADPRIIDALQQSGKIY